MGGAYDVLEKLPGGKLLLVERVESLEQAKIRFLCLTLSSRREYLVYDATRGCAVVLRAAA